jgi:hypothetical protein
MGNKPFHTNWEPVKEEIERLKERYRPFADVRPRPIMMKLIVWLDIAIKEIEHLRRMG